MATKRPARSPHRPGALGEEDVRALALALPDTEERPSYGTPGFRVADKLFARILPQGNCVVVKVTFEQRDVLVANAPDVFEVTPHYQGYPWVVVHLDHVSRAVLKEVLDEAWRLTAPAKKVTAPRRSSKRASGGRGTR